MKTTWMTMLVLASVCMTATNLLAEPAANEVDLRPREATTTTSPADAANLVTIVVTGMGTDKDEAQKDGMRKAVEQAAGQYIYSQSKTENFELVKDSILARAAGYIQSHEIVPNSMKTDDDGLVTLRLKCVVSRKGIVDTWGVVQEFLKQLGRPKVLVLINEKVDEVIGTVDAGRAIGQDSKKQIVQEASTLQGRIENLLLKSGFALVDKGQIEAIDKKDLQAAMAEDNPSKAQAIAKKFGAQIFIKGTAYATTGLPTKAYGVLLYTYESQGNVRVFRTDTAQVMSSQTTPMDMPARGAGQTWRNAADISLTVLGNKMAPAVQNDILRFWLDVTTGGGEVKLEVGGISFGEVVKLQKAIGAIKGVKDANREGYANQIVTFTIHTTLTGEKLAELLVDAKIGEKTLDITDATANVIKGKMKGGE